MKIDYEHNKVKLIDSDQKFSSLSSNYVLAEKTSDSNNLYYWIFKSLPGTSEKINVNPNYKGYCLVFEKFFVFDEEDKMTIVKMNSQGLQSDFTRKITCRVTLKKRNFV